METMWEVLRADWLLALVRSVGVVIGILGTAIASPEAVRAIGEALSTFMLTKWRWLRAALGFPRTIPVAGTVAATGGASGTITFSGSAAGSVWSDDLDEQVLILRERTDRLERALDTVRLANQADVSNMRAEMERMRSEHQTEVGRLRAAHEERERKNLRVNARGLPMIGAAIVLSGLPDPVVANPWFGWPLLLAALIVTTTVLGAMRGANAG